MRRQNLIILIFTFITISTSAQIDRLPLFEKNLPKDLTEKNWFLKILKNNFSDFIASSSSSVWSDKDYIQALASRNDSAFVVTIVRSSIDTSTTELHVTTINQKVYNQAIDTLKKLGFFQLRDEKKVSPCEMQTKEMINGKLVISSISTATITDGTQTNFFMYSNGTLRFAGYYHLDKVKEICPRSQTWQRVVAIDYYLDSIIKKHGS